MISRECYCPTAMGGMYEGMSMVYLQIRCEKERSGFFPFLVVEREVGVEY